LGPERRGVPETQKKQSDCDTLGKKGDKEREENRDYSEGGKGLTSHRMHLGKAVKTMDMMWKGTADMESIRRTREKDTWEKKSKAFVSHQTSLVRKAGDMGKGCLTLQSVERSGDKRGG